MSETLTDALLGRVIDGRYEVRERVASGGMATVYLALDRRLERMVAVKVMKTHFAADADKQEFVARFRREAKAAAKLTHPGMVRVYDQGVDGDISYLTMEYVDGQNLRKHLHREPTLPVGRALALIESILDALAAAHRQGLVHRDVKPENILIDPDGYPKLADFGLARAATEVTATASGMVLGTVAYLAPETAQRGVADPRSDVYAAGIVLFETLTGRQPFTGSSAIDVASRHIHEDVPAPSTFAPWIPAELDALVAVFCARDPQLRPADAAAALTALRRTRAMIDEPTLDRRADPPSGALLLGIEDATAVLDDAPRGSTIALPLGLNTGSLSVLDSMDDDPEAVEPSKTPRRTWLWLGAVLAAVIMMVSLGAWWYTTQGPGAYTTVPPVIEKTEVQARQILEAAGFDVVVLEQYDFDIPAGLVISSDPGPQERILKTDPVTIVVSLGPEMGAVPADIVGLTLDDAKNALIDAGFSVGEETGTHSDTVPINQVMSISPAAGEVIALRSPVSLEYSLGPAPVTVPDVITWKEAEARALLEGDDYVFRVTVVYERTADVKKGEVSKIEPGVGTETTRTAEVTITVSEGKPLVEMQSFVGLTDDQAIDLADQLGLVIDWKPYGNLPWFRRELVAAQEPAYGTTLEQGETITLFYVNE